ncbi:MAG: hypothetical protein ACYC35_22215 [Pirellulales bacterium]
MQDRHRLRLLVAALIAACGMGLSTRSSVGKEPVREFLDGLRQRELFDETLAYLAHLRTSGMVSDELRKTLPYEEGVTLVEGARTIQDVPTRIAQLEAGRKLLQEFLTAQPDHALAAQATTQLASVLLERGRSKAELAALPSQAARKAQLMGEARALFGEAKKVFADAEARHLAVVQKFAQSIDKNDPVMPAARDQARGNLVESRLLQATVTYETAKTYPAGGVDSKRLLGEAADTYGKLFEKYKEYPVGVFARWWQGRCFQDLDETKKALECYSELLALPDQPPVFRQVKIKSMRLALECWTEAKDPKDRNLVEAVNRGTAWLKQATGAEAQGPDGLAIRYRTADALSRVAEATKKKSPAKYKEYRADVVRHLVVVSRTPGEFQKAAKAKLVALGVEAVEAPTEAATFADAFNRGKDSLDAMQNAAMELEMARANGQTQDAPKLTAEIAREKATAFRYFRLALRLRGRQSPVEDVNQVRYFLCYLDWDAGDYYSAAVLGEFLARRYPKAPAARQGARIAMHSWAGLYNAVGAEADRQFQAGRMLSIADYITRQWPSEPEADEAWMVLINLAVRNQEYDKVVQYLERVPVQSPRRGETELKAGQALWGAYLRAARQPEGQRPAQAELDKIAGQARATLEQGIARMRKAVDEGQEVSYTLASAVLSLAQIHVGAAEAEKAIPWLEDKKIGPLTLVAAKRPVAGRDNFSTETYKAALRAYVAARKPDEALAIMNKLEALVAAKKDAEAGETLTRIYIGLGRELEELVTRLRNEKKETELAKVSAAFETFLDRIAERRTGNTLSSLNWVAEAFYSLGAGLDPGGKTADLPQGAKSYYLKAVKTYQRILDTAKSDPGFAPRPESVLGVQLRLAKCLRRLGRYDEAMEMLVGILKKKNRMLEAQIEAAYTYQAWGDVDPDYYTLAIVGGRKAQDKNGNIVYVVWGWGKLATMAAQKPEYRPIYHEARYNLAKCRLKQAVGSKQDKAALLAMAERDIAATFLLTPDMGGDDWSEKYDYLLKTIQRLAYPGRQPTGLHGLRTKDKENQKTPSNS